MSSFNSWPVISGSQKTLRIRKKKNITSWIFYFPSPKKGFYMSLYSIVY